MSVSDKRRERLNEDVAEKTMGGGGCPSALMTGQVGAPIVQAQVNSDDAKFRNGNVEQGQQSLEMASPAASPNAPKHKANDDRSSVTRTPLST